MDHDGAPPADAVAERQALGRVAHALRHYRSGAGWEVARWERNLSLLSPRHRALVPRLADKIKEARQCIFRNQLFISALLDMFEEDSGYCPPHLAPANAAADEHEARVGGREGVSPGDHDKVRYVLKNTARDWSEEGAAEREQSYGRIVRELSRLFASWPAGAEPPSVLVPGCGLGRLCLEITNQGFCCQGNEFSYFMLLASAYLLNGIDRELQWTIHPWVHNSCNQLSSEDQLRGLQVPDVHPAALVPESFDAVACCFFLDTAHNVLEYLEVIYACLKPGGYFVNLGPLLYHWADAHSYLPGEELSIELSLEEVKAAALQVGFRLVRDELVEASFLANDRSMMQASNYRCAFWTMQKPAAAPAAPGEADLSRQRARQPAAQRGSGPP